MARAAIRRRELQVLGGCGIISRWGRLAALTDRLERDLGSMAGFRAEATNRNDLDSSPVFAAARKHLMRWLDDGTAPPSAPRIEVDDEGPEIVRDEFGIAKGGVRIPDVEVPLATLTWATDGAEGSRVWPEAELTSTAPVYSSCMPIARATSIVTTQGWIHFMTAGCVLPGAGRVLKAGARSRKLPLD
jgi:Alpha/beta hydrolase domain